ncbi:DUF2304 domain-containing protein [Actinomycetospora chibensis]|uniref:DUF2304 domain-containing protein n=1 Tax=Actinomycetospora chibensis TaxID=663606 RepID=A0ABV9RIG7_9PSEU|nr:DUF2304 domain-containing protein [Actinomycetospora chibensis]MDD7922511.1 DUF2304 domain-containing protein [Actinomycetospora chibensis]
MARLTVITLVIALAAFVLVFELLRRRKLREKYAALWIVVAGIVVLLSIFPSLLVRAAAVLGVAVPSNLLFLMSLLVLFAVSLQLSREVGTLEEQTRRLAEEVGALRLTVEREARWRAEAEAAAEGSTSDLAEPLPTRGEPE